MKGIMTREYNKPRRNDSRPPFRQNSSSGRYGEEQSPRPGRPRLNREIVDRAWEQGAQTQHADYHPRAGNGQGRQQNNWRSNRPENSSYQNGTGGNRPYGNRRQANNPNDTDGNRPYGNRQQTNGAGGNRPYDNRQPRYDNPRNRQDNYQRSGPAPQGYRGTPQQPYDQDRYQGRTPGNRTNGDRPFQQRNYDQRGAPNDRRGYRSGPSRSYEDQPPRRPGGNGHRPPYEEHFEGDYEHFGYNNTRNHAPHSSGKPPRNQQYNRKESDSPTRERHVTRLPDGRVLKGPRPAQRKNAQFWTEIANDTEELMQQIPEPPVEELTNTDDVDVKEKKAHEKKPRAAQSKDGVRGKKSASEPKQSTGVKPSRRGFKWPTP